MTSPDLKSLLSGPKITADGAMGSLLLKHGYKISDCLAKLNLSNPNLIQDIHQKYLDAGAQVIYTHSFMANPLQLKAHQEESLWMAINHAAVANAKAAIQNSHHKNIWIAGNMGPLSPPTNKKQASEQQKSYQDQAKLLLDQGVSFLAIETITQLSQLKLILEAIAPLLPKTLLSVCTNAKGELFDGTPLETWANLLDDSKVAIIGLNCLEGPQMASSTLKKLSQKTSKPLSFKPNAGLPQKNGPTPTYPIDSKEFSDQMKAAHVGSLCMWGGCCGTTPSYIQQLKQIDS